ncbi:MAG: hypothetical protein RID91_19770 [Azospirillaceae bacterium]
MDQPDTPATADKLVEGFLGERIRNLEKILDTDCLSYVGPIVFGTDDTIRDALERIDGRRSGLTFILETTGGYAEVTRRISDACRHHYNSVNFIIPNHAMSAGTILAMSGDSIMMDYYSVLGPIDPQVQGREGRLVPALGYLMRYQDLLDKADSGNITTAEMNILMSFDQGELYAYEQARDLSVSLLEEWLVSYKFKNWKRTRTNDEVVTPKMKRERARDIAMKLNDVKRWNSHGIGINIKILRDELNLVIDDIDDYPEIRTEIREYHKILLDYMNKMSQNAVIHTRLGYWSLAEGRR